MEGIPDKLSTHLSKREYAVKEFNLHIDACSLFMQQTPHVEADALESVIYKKSVKFLYYHFNLPVLSLSLSEIPLAMDHARARGLFY